jgi:hypothetical protein
LKLFFEEDYCDCRAYKVLGVHTNVEYVRR